MLDESHALQRVQVIVGHMTSESATKSPCLPAGVRQPPMLNRWRALVLRTQDGGFVNEVVLRPRWYRNLHLSVCLISVLLIGGALAGMHTGIGRWAWIIMYALLAVFWARVAVRTCVRWDDRGLHSDRPMSKLSTSAAWEEVARFVHSGGVVRAELHAAEPIVVLDPSGDGRWVAQRLEEERGRRQQEASGQPPAPSPR
jgi:hypothetical protein